MGLLVFLLCVLVVEAPAGAEPGQRFALLVGNEDYPGLPQPLVRPHEDVDALGDVLEQLDFEVVRLRDAGARELELAVAELAESLRAAGPDAVGFFYYAGHGAMAAVGDTANNYMLPAREEIRSPTEVVQRGVRLEPQIDALKRASPRALFVVYDACRNQLSRSAKRGIELIPLRADVLIAMSTMAGNETPDDGAYAVALARQILESRREAAEIAFIRANRDVARSRDIFGMPMIAGGLSRPFCFEGCPGEAPTCSTAGADRALRYVDLGDPRLRIEPELVDDFVRTCGSAALERAAEDDPRAQVLAAVALGQGRHVDRDRARAVSLAKQACEGGAAAGCALEARLRIAGGDTSRGPLRGLKRACRDGSQVGCTELGEAWAARGKPNKATRVLRRSCEGGFGPACLSLSDRQWAAAGTGRDRLLTARLLRRACELGPADVCTTVARRLDQRGQMAESLQLSPVDFLDRGCAGGHADACEALEALARDGRIAPRALVGHHEAGVVSSYRELCVEGSAKACVELGEVYAEGRFAATRNDDEAMLLYRWGCEQGARAGCKALAGMYEAGRVGDVSHDRSIVLFEQKCEDEEAGWACAALGTIHDEGLGVPVDTDLADRRFREGCRLGAGEACTRRGIHHLAEERYDLAQRLFRRGCELSSPRACDRLGKLYERGQGLQQSDAEAVRFYERACRRSVGSACVSLALLHEAGRGGLSANLEEATRLLLRAVELDGDNTAAEHLHRLQREAQAQADAATDDDG